MATQPDQPEKGNGSAFPSTHWTLVQKIQRGSPDDARQAMEAICRSYWYPVYSFLRRSGQTQHDAEDLTQMFFQRLIEERSMNDAREERGRLRTFLLGVLKRSLADHFEKRRALKRGGSAQMISFDEQEAEARYALEPLDLKSPDAIFDRAWAKRVLESAEEKLRGECEDADDLKTFESLREFLPLGENATPYRKVAAKLKMEESTVRLQIHRMRKRYGRHIEEEIAQTVADSAEQKAELQHLMAAMGR
jgi:RNA polymerase sigma-70 factor (ECF subfamily)